MQNFEHQASIIFLICQALMSILESQGLLENSPLGMNSFWTLYWSGENCLWLHLLGNIYRSVRLGIHLTNGLQAYDPNIV